MRQGKPHRADDWDLVRLGIRELASLDDVRRRIAEIVKGVLVKMVQHNSRGACGNEEKKSQKVLLFSPGKNSYPLYPMLMIRIVISKYVHTLLRINMHQKLTWEKKREEVLHVTQNVNSIATKSLRKATFSVNGRCKLKRSSSSFCVLVPWWQGVWIL